ncbi:PqiC family protein [Gluconobacter thailandicus]|uniref:Membrane integrity-associated transporter subunit PqiC n=1 Tax=Gluconobacter thailandicus TaxID=257438 RepID=A0AAP9ESS0_GLUTH|nr:PqiC family protein [Gluconobacter thailandicus]QEH96793.1 membrane integrity-associated transporter subunit PqiC [Gluconobacter thailandicus]
MKLSFASLAVAGLLLSGCASAPIKFYTLGAPAIATATSPLNATTSVLLVDPILLPDYLDSQDMLVRHGDLLDRSTNGRWGSRLSRGMTDLVTAKLSQIWPTVFVTSHASSSTPGTRLNINVTRLDIAADGQGTLEADWSFIPSDEQKPVTHHRASFTAHGPIATDAENVALTRELVEQLSAAIGASTPSF